MPDTSIRTYRAKRDFTVTAEPAPAEKAHAGAAIFVVQKHQAARAGLHWDFRLEHGGVLWSWAVPKGPSLDPADRRMAIHVEDHPIDYAKFEGEIPAGQYGAGQVEVWDHGTWEALDDPEAGMRQGNLRFVLKGRRLAGRFTLARLRKRDPAKQEAWFLIKGHDDFAREGVGALELEASKKSPPQPKLKKPEAANKPGARIVVAKAPRKASVTIGGVEITHADRPLWPGITKADLANYWLAVAEHALPGLIQRPLSVLRCPEGVDGEHFFQKNGHGYLPPQIREGHAGGQPYLAIDEADGLVAMAQMSAIELHPWGATENDALHPDRLVFDLDPGAGVAFKTVVAAAHEVRKRLEALNLESFCRTSGGKGLHVVAPIRPGAAWDRARAFSHAFAETMAQDLPEQFVAHVKIADRAGKILVDWLRNGLGSTAIASFCPRARPGAGVATPLAWSEVKPTLDPSAFTVLTIPKRLARLKKDPWARFDATDQTLPNLGMPEPAKPAPKSGGKIVVARKPRPRT